MTSISMTKRAPRRLRRETHLRLYLHAAIFVLVTALLLTGGAYGYLSLRSAAREEYEKSVTKYDQTVAREQAKYERALSAYEEKIVAGQEAEGSLPVHQALGPKELHPRLPAE